MLKGENARRPAACRCGGKGRLFAYIIHEGKIRAPAAAMALIERLGRG
jgi:hypothetical protein